MEKRFWKQKEMVLRKAWELRPDGIRFVQDFAVETLQRRKEQIPKMLEARQMEKIAFFIGDRLLIKHKPPDKVSADDSQISFNLNDGTWIFYRWTTQGTDLGMPFWLNPTVFCVVVII